MTTYRTHAQLHRKVINNDNGGQALTCCWADCTRTAYEMYKHVMCEHDARLNCEQQDRYRIVNAGRTAHLNFVFCSERCRAYFVNCEGWRALESIANTGRAHGNLPVGMRNRRG